MDSRGYSARNAEKVFADGYTRGAALTRRKLRRVYFSSLNVEATRADIFVAAHRGFLFGSLAFPPSAIRTCVR